MGKPDSRLGGRVRTRLNEQVRARTDTPSCPLCGYWIDRSLQRVGRRHPLCSVIDEWIPRAKGGPVSLDNCVEVHEVCNGLKSDHWPVTTALRARCRARVEATGSGATVKDSGRSDRVSAHSRRW